MPIASSTSRSRAISLETFCELWGRKSSGSTRPGSRTSRWVRMIWSDPWKIWVLPRTRRIVAGLERPRQLFGGVPEPGADAAGLVAELELEVEIALAVGPELLVGDQVGLVDRIPMGKLVHVAAAHAADRFGERESGRGAGPGARTRG